METQLKAVEVKLIDSLKYKETHGLYVNGDLQYQGTEHECTFFQLKLQKMQKEKANNKMMV